LCKQITKLFENLFPPGFNSKDVEFVTDSKQWLPFSKLNCSCRRTTGEHLYITMLEMIIWLSLMFQSILPINLSLTSVRTFYQKHLDRNRK
jgi:hypothetical protein